MKLLAMLILASVAVLFLGHKTRERMNRGPGETDIAIKRIREERRRKHGN